VGVVASPRAKLTAQESGISLNQVSGTGPSGRILAADVVEFAQQPAPATTAASTSSSSTGSYTDIPLTQIRRVRNYKFFYNNF
jgi:pyruvate dehydrogenase E2 component (dihydrolipoamide acetyltransferase)